MFNSRLHLSYVFYFFFFNDTATTEIYTLSLHDALPIFETISTGVLVHSRAADASATMTALAPSRSGAKSERPSGGHRDRKSTRLNSSHLVISYAVFCLKKKKKNAITSSRVADLTSQSTS